MRHTPKANDIETNHFQTTYSSGVILDHRGLWWFARVAGGDIGNPDGYDSTNGHRRAKPDGCPGSLGSGGSNGCSDRCSNACAGPGNYGYADSDSDADAHGDADAGTHGRANGGADCYSDAGTHGHTDAGADPW